MDSPVPRDVGGDVDLIYVLDQLLAPELAAEGEADPARGQLE